MTAPPHELWPLEHAGWVHALARSLVRDAHRAEELAQDTLLVAWCQPPGDARSPRGWLAAVLRSLWRERRRRDALRAAREHDAARPEAAASATDVLERAAVAQRLVQHVMALDEPFRSTLLMRYFDGLAPRRIAERCGVPEATARSRLRRGLERLRARMDAERGGRSAWLSALAPWAAGAPLKSGEALATWAQLSGGTLMKLNAKLLVVAALAVAGGAWIVPRWMSDRAARADPRASGPALEPGAKAPQPTGEAAADAGPAEPAPESALAARAPEPHAKPPAPERSTARSMLDALDRTAETFLTDRPDVAGLADLVRELAEAAAVAEGSVATDEDGIVHGRLRLGGGALEGEFEIDGDRYRVQLPGLLPPDRGDAFFSRDLSLSWRDAGGRADPAGATVQFRPETRDDAREHLRPGEERFVGWSVAQGPEGSVRTPLTMRLGEDGRSWEIGHSRGLEPVHEPGVFAGGAWDAWLRALQPYAPR